MGRWRLWSIHSRQASSMSIVIYTRQKIAAIGKAITIPIAARMESLPSICSPSVLPEAMHARVGSPRGREQRSSDGWSVSTMERLARELKKIGGPSGPPKAHGVRRGEGRNRTPYDRATGVSLRATRDSDNARAVDEPFRRSRRRGFRGTRARPVSEPERAGHPDSARPWRQRTR